MSLIKSRLLETALNLCQNLSSDEDPLRNQIPSEFKAFKYLKKKQTKTLSFRKQILVVFLGKCSYISVIEEILHDKAKFL